MAWSVAIRRHTSPRRAIELKWMVSRLPPPPRLYLMLNKPRGTVTTASDEKGRETVYAFLNAALPWVAPVGRLDKASEGLLLLTNDSEWAARVMSPQSQIWTRRTMCKLIRSPIQHCWTQSAKESGRKMASSSGFQGFASCVVANATRWLEIILDEGKNRHIRRMLASLGVAVLAAGTGCDRTIATWTTPQRQRSPSDSRREAGA